MTNLRNNFSFRCFHRYLNVTWNNKHIVSYKSITFAHAVKAVFQSKVLRSIDEHSLSNIQNALHYFLVIHNLPTSKQNILYVIISVVSKKVNYKYKNRCL